MKHSMISYKNPEVYCLEGHIKFEKMYWANVLWIETDASK